MRNHTTPELVQVNLNSDTPFSSNTLPTLDTINVWIEEASNQLNELTDNRYGEQTTEDILDYDGSFVLRLQWGDVKQVTVSYNTAKHREAPVWEELTLYDDYLLESSKGRIVLARKPVVYKAGKQKFKVNYTTGKDETPGWLQSLATRMVVSRVLESSINARAVDSEAGTQVRVGAVSIINPADYGLNNYKNLKEGIQQDINDLKKQSRAVRYVNYKSLYY